MIPLIITLKKAETLGSANTVINYMTKDCLIAKESLIIFSILITNWGKGNKMWYCGNSEFDCGAIEKFW